MVKIQRLITIDSELNDKLKEQDNASALINSLLLSHFDYLETDNLNLLESKRVEKSNQREIIDKELEHITDKIILIKQKEKESFISEEKRLRLKEISVEVEELKNKWSDELINDELYWIEMDKLQEEKDFIKYGNKKNEE